MTQQQTADGEVTTKSRFRPVNSREFDELDLRQEWLIEELLIMGQPGVIGGPQKSLKTSLMIDMAISLAGGTPFLGRFKIPKPSRVIVFSGESGQTTIRETARRVCRAKQVKLRDCQVYWEFDLPSLAEVADRNALYRAVRTSKAKVVFIDPLYLCLLGRSKNISASNLYEVGPVLRLAAQACLKAGATPIFLHHTVKSATTKRQGEGCRTLDLQQLAFAGVGEFVRQWVLLDRRKPYAAGSGRHELLMTVGGSAGQSGTWDLEIHEGRLNRDFSGRTWAVTVRDPSAPERPPRHPKLQDVGSWPMND